MSLMPERAPQPSLQGLPGEEPITSSSPAAPRRRLRHILLALITLEVGLFLAIFPWLDTWNMNYLKGLSPILERIWNLPSFRGALTGLGLVNIYLACLEVIGLFRRS
jgi:hypothetical protein